MFALSKYTVVYEKKGRAQYISHLDFLRTIGRALRRAGIPIKYSEGFNPHPVISFAAPLSVGTESSCEMFCVSLTDDIAAQDFSERINPVLPEGIKVRKVFDRELDFNIIDRADYVIYPEIDISNEEIVSFMAQDRILMEKKTKRGTKETDIKTDIFNISAKDNIITATLKAGNHGTLKATLLISALAKFLGKEEFFCRYERLCFRDAEGNII